MTKAPPQFRMQDGKPRYGRDQLPVERSAKSPARLVKESHLQTTFADFLDLALPEGFMWWHVPNEGKRGPQAQREFKKWGAKAGVLDIHILGRGRFIVAEVKRPGEKMTPAQETWADQVTLCGGLFLGVFDSLDAFIESLATTIPLRPVEVQ